MSDVLKLFAELNAEAVEPEGIRIPHAVARVDGRLDVMALAMVGPDAAAAAYAAVARVLVRHRPRELVFGQDRFARPGQGVATPDCLSVHHWDGRGWRFGVIAYRHDVPAFFGEVDWDNAFWIRALRDEMAACWGRIVAAPHRMPSPAMALPLPVVAQPAVDAARAMASQD